MGRNGLKISKSQSTGQGIDYNQLNWKDRLVEPIELVPSTDWINPFDQFGQKESQFMQKGSELASNVIEY